MLSQLNFTRVLLAMAIGYILFLQMCGSGRAEPCPEIVSEKTDTQRLYRQWQSSWKKPAPDTVIKPAAPSPAPRPDTVLIPGEPIVIVEPVDTAAIIQDYKSLVVYKDSSRIIDSTGMDYGTAYVTDTLTENRIDARRWSFNVQFPVITKTVTVREPSRFEVYTGFSVLAGERSVGAELSLALKDRRDRQYEIGGGAFNRMWYGKVGTKFKLSFRNH